MREQQKAAWERKMFLRAVSFARIEVVPGSVESRPSGSGEPDILCTLASGERVAFELVELVDEDVARVASDAISGAFAYGDPTRRILHKKLVGNKDKYRSSHPMELLAFGGDCLLPRDAWVPTHDNNLVRDWLAESPFRRVRVVNIGRLDPGLWLDCTKDDP